MEKEKIRFGKIPERRSNKTRILLPVLVGLLIAFGTVVFFKKKERSAKKVRGCLIDKDCRKGSICAAGGCIILLSSEIPDMWHDDIAAQMDASVSWNPRSTFGEKLERSTNCEGGEGVAPAPDFENITSLSNVNVYELESDALWVHSFKKAKASMWFESLRFELGRFLKPAPKSVCVSDSIDKYQIKTVGKKGSQGLALDVSFSQAAPVGSVASVAVSLELDLPKADSKEFRTINILLDAAANAQEVVHTVAAFPLGSTIKSIQGPPPGRQRLLSGYTVYYWRAGTEPTEATITFKLPPFTRQDLDLTAINP